MFSDWLEETFGTSLLQRGILDVAGGRGDISFELSARRAFRSIVVDPRPVKLSKTHFRYFRQERKRREKLRTTGPLDGSPRKKREDPLASEVIEQHLCLFDESFLASQHALMEGVGLLVGMHPDEATEPIVDYALREKRPFAVVPCCVFAVQNPHRRLQNGNAVRTYEDYMCYLQEKAPDVIRCHTLPFEGRNQVLYSFGSSPPC